MNGLLSEREENKMSQEREEEETTTISPCTGHIITLLSLTRYSYSPLLLEHKHQQRGVEAADVLMIDSAETHCRHELQ
jgi:hypothetical protein